MHYFWKICLFLGIKHCKTFVTWLYVHIDYEFLFKKYLSFSLFFLGVNSLQITEFSVPIAVKVGENHQLSCQYQLSSNETLYFLRWYKDGNEFFRYMPKETPAQRVYNVSGVRIKVNQTSLACLLFPQSCQIVLQMSLAIVKGNILKIIIFFVF